MSRGLLANNRMYLVDARTGNRTILAAYFPSNGWYIYHEREVLDEWFEKVRWGTTNLTFGDTYFHLLYETVSDDEFAEMAGAEEFGE